MVDLINEYLKRQVWLAQDRMNILSNTLNNPSEPLSEYNRKEIIDILTIIVRELTDIKVDEIHSTVVIKDSVINRSDFSIPDRGKRGGW